METVLHVTSSVEWSSRITSDLHLVAVENTVPSEAASMLGLDQTRRATFGLSFCGRMYHMHIHPQNVPTCGASDRCLVHYESSANMEQGVRKDPTFTTRFGSSYLTTF
jgi:hypothetical protein